ncbi:MAG: hypothetical protein EOM03_13980 [Clostridia bacterium]|nr:hypothetical protein [Clostridia bacterium]
MKRSINPLRAPWRRWQNIGKRVMTLVLIISCGGCGSTGSQLPIPSLGSGNAVLSTLPAGTLLIFPRKEEASQMGRLFLNESEPIEGDPRGVRLERPLKLATPEYLLQRDAAEAAALLELLKYRSTETDR